MKSGSVKLVLLFLALTFLFFLDLIVGSVKISFSEIFIDESTGSFLFFEYRLPKALTAVLAGSALAVSGNLMQVLFNNPLAGPYVLGVNSVSNLMVALVMMSSMALGIVSQVGIHIATIIMSVAGAFFALLIVLGFSVRIKSASAVLLAGLMLGFIAGGMESVIQFLSRADALKEYIIWNMGSLNKVSLDEIPLFAGIVLFLLLLSFFQIKPLNALLHGEEFLQSVGFSFKRTQIILIIITAGLAGIVTAFCGPLGFVGLVAPHVARMVMKRSDNRFVLPASMFCGGIILLFCDTLASSLFGNFQIPINIITALIGAPFVLYLILKDRGRIFG